MANINLAWTNPTATDIDNICVHKLSGDHSATYPNGTINATDAATFAAAAGAYINQDSTYTDTSAGAKTYTDSTASNTGTHTYGVFSKNGSGYGPGEAVTITY